MKNKNIRKQLMYGVVIIIMALSVILVNVYYNHNSIIKPISNVFPSPAGPTDILGVPMDLSGLETEVIDRSYMTAETPGEAPIIPLEQIHCLPLPEGYILNGETEYRYSSSVDKPILIPELNELASEEMIYSAIEDEMVYTLTRVYYNDETTGTILYINKPISFEFVACSVMHEVSENETYTNLYTFF